MVPPGGFLRGEQFERERVVPPLSRTTFLPFLPEQESKAPLASACRKPIEEQMKRLKMGIDNRKQVPPQKQTGTAPPAGSLSHGEGHRGLPGRASSLPEGAMGFCLSTLDFCKLESACCNPSVKNQRFLPAPTGREPLGAVSIPGIKNPAAS